MKNEELVPVEQVLEDMYDDYSPVQVAARDYYYQHYATPEERVKMDRENKVSTAVALGIWAFVVAGAVYAVISQFII